MLAFLVLAAEQAADHGSKTAFYAAGAVLAAWALLIGGVGVARPAFAGVAAVSRAVLAITAVLVALTVVTAVATS